MAFGDTPLAIVGNLADDPDYRVTPSGRGVAKFRVIVNSRVKQGDQWVDGQPSIYPCVAWEQLGENVAQSLSKGARVIVTGTWAQTKPYQDRNGATVYPWELRVEAIGPDLRYASARVAKMDRASSRTAPAGGSDFDPWATAEDVTYRAGASRTGQTAGPRS